MSIWSAGRYEAVAQRIAPISVQLIETVDRLRPLDGAVLVDLACGTGNAALAAAAAGAQVTGVDLTPELLAIAADKAGGDGVHWIAADASATGLPDAGFDAVVSNMGIIFVEPVSQVAEIARLLRPGGFLGFSTWVRDTDNPFFNPIIDVLGTPPAAQYSPDQWGQPDIVTARLTDDFDEIFIEHAKHTWRFGSVQDAVVFVTEESPMHVDLFTRSDEGTTVQLTAAFTAAFERYADADGVAFDASYAVVAARRR